MHRAIAATVIRDGGISNRAHHIIGPGNRRGRHTVQRSAHLRTCAGEITIDIIVNKSLQFLRVYTRLESCATHRQFPWSDRHTFP